MATMRSRLKNKRGTFFPNWDLNHSPLELEASVLPIGYMLSNLYQLKPKRSPLLTLNKVNMCALF